ncbi:MAG: LapA family protein [Deltaproteobacteria bacterium]|nr:LapA family protein [Deltaproteobacteria bacterium]
MPRRDENPQPTAVKFLFWEFSTSTVLSILISFSIGFSTGWLVSMVKLGRKKD